MATLKPNLLTVLGPTASGKTALGVRLARRFGGEIISADSRQVYRGLDLGTGKDLAEYRLSGTTIPYHLIDVVDLDFEYNTFHFQQACYRLIEQLHHEQKLPLLVGGTGLYLESVLLQYPFVEAPPSPELRSQLQTCSKEELLAKLINLGVRMHNTTDSEDRKRLIRSIEIATQTQNQLLPKPPPIVPLVLGIHFAPAVLRERIWLRLEQRLQQGMLEEVENLLRAGIPKQRLISLGLEYRYLTLYLVGEIKEQAQLKERLYRAICQFARRQRSWFRRMERRGVKVHWLEEADEKQAIEIVEHALANSEKIDF